MYCQVLNNQPGRPQDLPVNWHNISNFNTLSAADLISHGWYLFVPAARPAHNPATHRIVESAAFTGNFVDQVWTVLQLTDAEILAYKSDRLLEIGRQISQFLDRAVQRKQYDTVISATSWNLSAIDQYKAEGAEAAAYRDQVWQLFSQLVAGVQAGTTPLPEIADWFASLPVLWPPAPPAPPLGNGTFSGGSPGDAGS